MKLDSKRQEIGTYVVSHEVVKISHHQERPEKCFQEMDKDGEGEKEPVLRGHLRNT